MKLGGIKLSFLPFLLWSIFMRRFQSLRCCGVWERREPSQRMNVIDSTRGEVATCVITHHSLCSPGTLCKRCRGVQSSSAYWVKWTQASFRLSILSWWLDLAPPTAPLRSLIFSQLWAVPLCQLNNSLKAICSRTRWKQQPSFRTITIALWCEDWTWAEVGHQSISRLTGH